MESGLEQNRSIHADARPVSRFFRFGLASITALVLGGIILGVTRALGMLVGDHPDRFQTELTLIVPFALVVGIAAAAYPRRWLSCRGDAFIVAAIGAAVGCLSFYISPGWMMLMSHLNVWQHVPWFDLAWFVSPDFEFQMASCWIVTGALAMLVSSTRRTPTILVAVAVVCVLAVVLPAPLFNFVTKNQELTVAFVVPVSAAASAAKQPRVVNITPNWLNEAGANAVASHVLEALSKAGLPGTYRVAEIDRCGTGKKALQIIVLNPPVPAQQRLPQPDGKELIYVSKPEGWRTIPAQAPTLSRSVEVSGPATDPAFLATYCIDTATNSGPCGAGIRPE
jgi:hypothetical protein